MKILVIDDSSFSRRVLRQYLEKSGHEVIEAKDGLAGLEQFSLQKPDFILLDLLMPELDGLAILVALKSIDPESRIVICTADIQKETRCMVELGGAVGLINKPVDSKWSKPPLHSFRQSAPFPCPQIGDCFARINFPTARPVGCSRRRSRRIFRKL